MVITDATGTQLTAHQICFKEYIKYLKYNGDSGHNGDRTYSTTYTTTTTTTTTNNNNNIIISSSSSSSISSICYTKSCVPAVSAIPIIL